MIILHYKKIGSYKRFLLLFLLFITFVIIYFSLQNRETSMVTYPKDFLTMRCINPSNDNSEDTPLVYANGQNAKGSFRIVYYRDFDTFEEQYPSGDWIISQTVYKNANYITSEGISVDSSKKNVVSAYQKYDLQEYNISKITSMNLSSLDIVLKGIDLADTFLYVDNHNIFSDSYQGTDYWGGLGAILFILDQSNMVIKIVKVAPTAG